MLDNFSPHLTTKTDTRVGDYAAANNIELVYVPFNASWLNRIEAQFTGLRYFALDGTDHPTHAEQGRTIRRYIHWRNHNTHDRRLRTSSTGQTLPDTALDRALLVLGLRGGLLAQPPVGLHRLDRAGVGRRRPPRHRQPPAAMAPPP